jgi:ABC-type branched-subunit amino acid transport system substrate-binding protein
LARILGVFLLLAAGLLQACAPQTQRATAPAPTTTAQPAPGRIRVGLMLPLSGRQASLGRALAQAAQAAFLEQGDDRLELVQADSEGTPDGAARAATALLGQGVAIVVGPLLATEVRGAAGTLRGAGVPMVSLSSDVAAAEQGVFVTGLLPADQVRAGLSFLRTAGAERVAVLAADDASGRAFADAARAVGMELSMDVTRVGLYAPAAGPSSALAQVTRPDAPQRGQPAPAAGAPAALPFDTLLLPDSGSRLRQVTAALTAGGFDSTSTRLLGPALWVAEPDLSSDPALAGALFPAPDEQAWDQLAARLGTAFGSRPPRLSLIAYDAMGIAVAAARQGRAGPVAPAVLLAPEGFAGATGRVRLLANGQSQRQMRIYQFAPEGMRNLGPTPFDPPLALLPRASARG